MLIIFDSIKHAEINKHYTFKPTRILEQIIRFPIGRERVILAKLMGPQNSITLSYTATFILTFKKVLLYLFHGPMFGKIKTNLLLIPAKETPNMGSK